MVVLDTSIIYKWLREEDNRHLSLKILDDFLDGKEEVIVPDIILYELSNALAFKKELTEEEILEAWEFFIDLNIQIFVPDSRFVEKCIKFAKKYRVTVYDASYAVLAKEKRCNLITKDEKFAETVNLPFVQTLSDYKQSLRSSI